MILTKQLFLYAENVNDAGSSAVCHRLAIPTGTKRIRVVRVNLSKATRCEDGGACDDFCHLACTPVMEVRTHTGKRSVNLEAVQRVVAGGYQVNAGLLGGIS